MFRSCSRCGKIHLASQSCNVHPVKRIYPTGEERRLRSSHKWSQKSLEIRERANYLCEVCRDQGRYTFEGLEVHHIEPLRTAPDRLLDNSNLICLCVMHHKQADEGKLDSNYLESLAERREKDPPA